MANGVSVRVRNHRVRNLVEMSAAMQKEVEKHFSRGELRRVAADEVGRISYPARVRETYAAGLLATLDVEAIRARRFRLVVDYGFSGASYVLPLVMGPLGVETVSAHAFPGEGPDRADSPPGLAASIGQAKRLVPALGADLAAVFDRSAERLHLIDEKAREIPVEQALLLFLRLVGASGRAGKAAFPVTVTSQVERIVAGTELDVVRTPTSLAELTKAAAGEGVVFAGAVGGGYVFPEFLPAYDAIASLVKLLELLAGVEGPISELVAGLPEATLVHHQLPCPWALKGLIMRVLNEQLSGRDLDLTDGIKLQEERGWMQVLPDPDEPLIHLYAEGETREASEELAAELRELVEEIEEGEAAASRT